MGYVETRFRSKYKIKYIKERIEDNKISSRFTESTIEIEVVIDNAQKNSR